MERATIAYRIHSLRGSRWAPWQRSGWWPGGGGGPRGRTKPRAWFLHWSRRTVRAVGTNVRMPSGGQVPGVGTRGAIGRWPAAGWRHGAMMLDGQTILRGTLNIGEGSCGMYQVQSFYCSCYTHDNHEVLVTNDNTNISAKNGEL